MAYQKKDDVNVKVKLDGDLEEALEKLVQGEHLLKEEAKEETMDDCPCYKDIFGECLCDDADADENDNFVEDATQEFADILIKKTKKLRKFLKNECEEDTYVLVSAHGIRVFTENMTLTEKE